MAKFYSTLDHFKRRDKREILQGLTSLDIAILERTKTGADYYEVLNACKPYKNKLGLKCFATNLSVKRHIRDLRKKDLLEVG